MFNGKKYKNKNFKVEFFLMFYIIVITKASAKVL